MIFLENFWCEVNLGQIAENIEIIRKNTNKKVLAVVKCNAYGLGIERITRFLDDKVDGFVVNNMDEALKVNSQKPVLILIPNISESDVISIKDNFILSVDNVNMLNMLKGRKYNVHISVDTGMNRFGVKPQAVESLINTIRRDYQNIKIDGIYTHLNNTNNRRYTLQQIDIFRNIVQKYGSGIQNVHLLSSKGYLKYNQIDFDNSIRIGSLLYGYGGREYGFKQAFSYKAKLISTSQIEKNEHIGYGNAFKVREKTSIGILNIGTINGFNCSRNVNRSFLMSIIRILYSYLKKNYLVLYNRKPVRILGNSCMCFTTLNLNGLNIDRDTVFDIKISSVLVDSSVEKKYIYMERC